VEDKNQVDMGLLGDRHLFNGLFTRTTWVSRHQKG